MFKTVNPYDEVVAKATSETQTDENWDIYLTVWDKVNEDKEAGARNCVAALQKRLQHRNANVQLFALTLADALVSNCGPALHREISGKAFTQTLKRLVDDRTTHENVKKRIMKIMQGWVTEHKDDSNFDLMVETYDSLKAQNHKLVEPESRPSQGPSDDILRREEEELQRALAESAALADPLKGFQKSQPQSSSYQNDYNSFGKALPQQPGGSGRAYSPVDGGFVPPNSSSVIQDSTTRHQSSHSQAQEPPAQRKPSRVQALYDFETAAPEELPFRRGEIINVVECVYDTWWMGELRGRRGIFPTTYVEELPDLPPSQAAKQAPLDDDEAEAQLFSKASTIDRLLTLMRNIDPQRENVAQNEELLDLYQESMSMRPQIARLIEKYQRKQDELRMIHDKYDRASATYDRMRQESDQRYSSGPYQTSTPVNHLGQDQQSQQQYPPLANGRPDPRALAGLSDEQRRQYEEQWAQYEQQMAEYLAHQRAAQYYQQYPQAHAGSAAPTAAQSNQSGPPPAQHHGGPVAQAHYQQGPQSQYHPQSGQQPLVYGQPGVQDGQQQSYGDPSQVLPQHGADPNAAQLYQQALQGPYAADPALAQRYPPEQQQPSVVTSETQQPQQQHPPPGAPEGQGAQQPYWDEQRREWVYPQQFPPQQQQGMPPRETVDSPGPGQGVPHHQAQLSVSFDHATPVQQGQYPPQAGPTQGYSQAVPAPAPTQSPIPNQQAYGTVPPSIQQASSPPPSHAQHQSYQAAVGAYGNPSYQLADQMQNLSVNPSSRPPAVVSSPPPASTGYPQANAYPQQQAYSAPPPQ